MLVTLRHLLLTIGMFVAGSVITVPLTKMAGLSEGSSLVCVLGGGVLVLFGLRARSKITCTTF
jgi:hypothetical protein